MKPLHFILALFCTGILGAQNPQEDKIKTTNFPKLKELVSTNISGAITFSQPKRITGTKQEIRTEKHGLVYPAFYDWNKDGKKDLMLGEFETGDTGSNIKVYLNSGSNKKPKYSGEYFYATDVKGDTITNYQWCCIGIHPRVVDLNQDGYDDILSGQYNPGAISWWRGSKDGFLPRVFVDQEGYRGTRELSQSSAPWKEDSNSYWNYTTSDFADFNGDGLLDLFVGGSGDMRVALNIGTKENPKFGHRNYLHHVDGKILEVKRPSQELLDEQAKQGIYEGLAGVWKTYMKPVDWDKDGVLDLLVTYEYKKKYHNAIEFYRGVKTDKGLRFEKRVPLITAKDGSKALPGVQPMITIVDYNEDGIEDVVFGLSIPTINGFEVADEIAWAWAGDLKIPTPGKDAGRQIKYYDGGIEGIKEKLKKEPYFKKYMLGNLKDEKYLTMRHRGYVFVMYGKKATSKAITKTVTAAPAEVRQEIKNEIVKGSNEAGPVQYEIKVPQRIGTRNSFMAEVIITFDEKWHGYVNNVANKKGGFIPTTVTFEGTKWIKPVGELKVPTESYEGLAKVYKGSVIFKQEFKLDLSGLTRDPEAYEAMKKDLNIKTNITYQTCDENICLPPKKIEETFEMTMSIF